MDYMMIDVGKVEGAAVGDLVTIIGEDGGTSIQVEELAKMAGTIPYEITCGIGRRVRRVAVGGTDKTSSTHEDWGMAQGGETHPSEPKVEIR
jgi:hypothetical protein